VSHIAPTLFAVT